MKKLVLILLSMLFIGCEINAPKQAITTANIETVMDSCLRTDHFDEGTATYDECEFFVLDSVMQDGIIEWLTDMVEDTSNTQVMYYKVGECEVTWKPHKAK